jgi:hypothetical protein
MATCAWVAVEVAIAAPWLFWQVVLPDATTAGASAGWAGISPSSASGTGGHACRSMLNAVLVEIGALAAPGAGTTSHHAGTLRSSGALQRHRHEHMLHQSCILPQLTLTRCFASSLQGPWHGAEQDETISYRVCFSVQS